jgi:hypothetical protein
MAKSPANVEAVMIVAMHAAKARDEARINSPVVTVDLCIFIHYCSLGCAEQYNWDKDRAGPRGRFIFARR